MTWFFLALGSAFFLATADFLTKRYFQDLPLPQVVIARFFGTLPVALLVLAVKDMGPLPAAFWEVVALALPAEILAMLLYMRGIQVSPLSLTQPFLAFTPLFSVFTSGLLLAELPTAGGLIGVALLIAGVYMLNLHKTRLGWAAPLLAVRDEPGSWMLLGTAALYGYTAVMGRKAILLVGPWPVVSIYFLGVFVSTVLFIALFMRAGFGWEWLKRPWPLTGLGVTMSGMIVCHMLAMEMVQAPYMLSIKRCSILISMLYGGWLLGESRLGQHLAAAGVMVAGAALILILG